MFRATVFLLVVGACYSPELPPAPGGDAGGGGGQQMTFGDRADADVQGVTADTGCDVNDPLLNFGAIDAINTSSLERGLLWFDVTALPAGATVIEAEIHLRLAWEVDADGAVQVFRLLEGWDEGSAAGSVDAANCVDRRVDVPWTDYDIGSPSSHEPDALATLAVDGQGDIAYVVALPPSLVQAWRQDDGSNHGVMFQGAAGLTNPHPHFASREHADGARRPLLVVEYE
jgi:hypothetical protein